MFILQNHSDLAGFIKKAPTVPRFVMRCHFMLLCHINENPRPICGAKIIKKCFLFYFRKTYKNRYCKKRPLCFLIAFALTLIRAFCLVFPSRILNNIINFLFSCFSPSKRKREEYTIMQMKLMQIKKILACIWRLEEERK